MTADNSDYNIRNYRPEDFDNYVLLGQEVKTLIDEPLQAGEHHIQWTADNVASGTYFIRLRFEGFSETQKVILLK